jgi:hypothetical protein
MKRFFLYLSLILIVAFCLWLALYRNAPQKSPLQRVQLGAPSKVEPLPITNAPHSTAEETELPRPPGIDDESWNRLMLLRKFVFEENKPVEFYARVVDQNEQPVSGAKMALRLGRMDESIFSMTNFPHWDPEKAVRENNFDLFSDANGWIQVAGTNGSFLNVWGLTKEGYLSSYPNGNFGGVSYEPHGRRNPSGDILMTNAWNPQKGYTFHLWKKGQTERLIHMQTGVSFPRPQTNAAINLLTGYVSEAGSNGDLQIQVEFLYPNDPNRPVDRRIYFRGINGVTLVEAPDPYPYSAVETGYVSEVSYDVLPSAGYGPNGTWNWKKNFYVEARSGRVRGAIQVDFDSGNMNIGISGYFNPAGSPKLEPDPEKLITDPEEIRKIDEATRVK